MIIFFCCIRTLLSIDITQNIFYISVCFREQQRASPLSEVKIADVIDFHCLRIVLMDEVLGQRSSTAPPCPNCLHPWGHTRARWPGGGRWWRSGGGEPARAEEEEEWRRTQGCLEDGEALLCSRGKSLQYFCCYLVNKLFVHNCSF